MRNWELAYKTGVKLARLLPTTAAGGTGQPGLIRYIFPWLFDLPSGNDDFPIKIPFNLSCFYWHMAITVTVTLVSQTKVDGVACHAIFFCVMRVRQRFSSAGGR